MAKVLKVWRVLEVLNSATEYLRDKGIENPRLNAEHLLADVLSVDRVQLYVNFERPLTAGERAAFKSRLQRRAHHEPLQYILGQTEFFSLPFRVTPDVLIPRPETEILVEQTLAACRKKWPAATALSVLDVGTGSGCIAVALAHELENAAIFAIDISSSALEIAKQNAQRNAVAEKISFMKMDFLNLPQNAGLPEAFHTIVANPPYVSSADFRHLPAEVKDYEPVVALKDDADGLRFFDALARFSSQKLEPGGCVLVEVGFGQAGKVQKMFQSRGLAVTDVVRDLNGIERVVCAEFVAN